MLDSHLDLLRALHDPLLDGLFHRPSRIGVESAWYGHVPFGYWIVGKIRPRMVVELGTHYGVSYAAFCDAVVDGRLATRCFAVDTWQGDQHSGRYGDDVFADLREFHDQRYGRFSSLLRMTFDAALEQMPDDSIDLLHIDGEHTYDAVKHDFEAWRPKLSDRAVVLFHDTNVRERDFGVWRLWHELRQSHPGFEFLHAHGLGVLAIGSHVSPIVTALCELSEEAAIAAVRERFALIGERWQVATVLQLREQFLAERYQHLAQERDRFEELARQRAADAARAQQEIAGLSQQKNAVTAQLNRLTNELSLLRHERDVIVGSTIWRATAPLRTMGRAVPAPLRRIARGAMRSGRWLSRLPAWRSARAEAAPDVPRLSAAAMSVVFISGESHTPGHQYRVVRSCAAASAIGAQTQLFTIAEALDHLPEIAGAKVVVIWRAPWSDTLAEIMRVAREAGAKIVYDIDDLMFLPELARIEVIDGIRSQNFDEDAVAEMFRNVRRALLAADVCTCPTKEIALRVRAYQKPAVVLPNGFNEALHRRARLALRQWRAQEESDIVRIGYAGGSRTHQKDFAVVSDVIACILAERPECRLVLFRSETQPLIDIDEYPALGSVANQIEWRLMRPLEKLPDELARFDINLAPLEAGNPFCEAKSELKFFEAALVDVCTVASPTGPFQRSIREAETGFIAASSDEWYRRLLALIDDRAMRRQIGHAAYLDVVWKYGPQRREESVAALLQQLKGGADAARAVELEALRQSGRHVTSPVIPDAATIFHADHLGEADVTVVVPVYNYRQFVTEALESVRRQSLQSIDLVVVDDASTDDSLSVVCDWAQRHAERFNRVVVLKNRVNAGLALTRNVAIDAAETPYVFLLDADNRLLPDCCAICLEALRASRAAFAYPRIQCFGDSTEIIGTPPFEPMRLAGGNYIDAMALVAKWAWAAVGGYTHLRHGWEDYDFWCSLVERGCWGIAVPQVLAEYRVHGASMLRTMTDVAQHKRELIQALEQRHPWLAIPYEQ